MAIHHDRLALALRICARCTPACLRVTDPCESCGTPIYVAEHPTLIGGRAVMEPTGCSTDPWPPHAHGVDYVEHNPQRCLAARPLPPADPYQERRNGRPPCSPPALDPPPAEGAGRAARTLAAAPDVDPDLAEPPLRDRPDPLAPPAPRDPFAAALAHPARGRRRR